MHGLTAVRVAPKRIDGHSCVCSHLLPHYHCLHSSFTKSIYISTTTAVDFSGRKKLQNVEWKKKNNNNKQTGLNRDERNVYYGRIVFRWLANSTRTAQFQKKTNHHQDKNDAYTAYLYAIAIDSCAVDGFCLSFFFIVFWKMYCVHGISSSQRAPTHLAVMENKHTHKLPICKWIWCENDTTQKLLLIINAIISNK